MTDEVTTIHIPVHEIFEEPCADCGLEHPTGDHIRWKSSDGVLLWEGCVRCFLSRTNPPIYPHGAVVKDLTVLPVGSVFVTAGSEKSVGTDEAKVWAIDDKNFVSLVSHKAGEVVPFEFIQPGGPFLVLYCPPNIREPEPKD